MKKLMLLAGVVVLAGCGPTQTWEQRQASKEAEKAAKVKSLSDQIAQEHGAVVFPSTNISVDVFTIEVQRCLPADAKKAILFRGHLDDIEKTESGIVVEFVCPLEGPAAIIQMPVVRFKLAASDEVAKQCLTGKSKGLEGLSFRLLGFGGVRYMMDPGFFVVARIDGLKKIRRYEFTKKNEGGEVEISVDVQPSFESTGSLIKAVPIPSD